MQVVKECLSWCYKYPECVVEGGGLGGGRGGGGEWGVDGLERISETGETQRSWPALSP